jgi:oxepin-CoA hydrolase/3-oxo-5,6-dehydrosuberyl-CoA semialdehyde dehydrogenase
VQLNAYNLPVWSLLRRFAPAFLAGMPSVVKPDRRTAYLTERAVHHIVESGLLPEGTLSLLCAGPTGLLDVLTAQDTLSFTGSAAAARVIRAHAAIANRSVPCTVETDTANAAILGPDVTLTDPELGRYVDHLVTDLTRKAGQRSTAIRRAFVPDALADDVTEAIRARLATVAIGHPALPETEMGPLVGPGQRDEVRAAIGRLSVTAKVAFGDPHTVDVAGADAARGAFISPVLLRGDGAFVPEPHEVVAFGPVCTVLPYATLDEVVTAVALGGGGLTGSIVTNDPDTAHQLLTELAPWHGRLRVFDRSHDPVEVAPQLMHGGPGRAGGGAELGGLHALTQYQQKTAIQGHRSFPWRPYS